MSLRFRPLFAALLAVFPVLNASHSLAADPSDAAPSSTELPDLGTAPKQNNNLAVHPGPGGVTLESTFDKQKVIVAPEYSNETGASLGVTFATLLGQDAAVGVLLNIGNDKKEWLINAGYKLDERQRIVVTAGQLKQFLDYAFISGTEKVGLTQNSGAVSYQFQLGKEFLRFLEVNGYVAKTDSRDLTDKTFAIDTATLFELWNDPRRIAGGKVTGLQGRLGFAPIEGGLVKVSLGQERLSYDLLAGTGGTNRLTAGVEWMQQLSNGYNLKATADTFASQNRYTLGVERSLSGNGGRHTLGVSLAGLLGRDGIGNDKQIKLTYSYAFGTDGHTSSAINLKPTAAAVPVQASSWTSSGLLDQVVMRPSFIPSHVVAKIDNTALPIRLIAVDKTALAAGSSINTTTGDITTPLGVVVVGIASVTKNLAVFTNTGQFSLSGNSLVTKPSLITQPTVGVVDSYVITVNNSGGGTTLATVLVSHGSVKVDSIIVTAGVVPDGTPDAFTFVDQTYVARNALTESAAITVAGINIATAISVTGGEYQINGGAWTTTAGTVTNGQTVKVRHTSSAGDSTATNTALTIGGVSDTFTSTTPPTGYLVQGGLLWMPMLADTWANANTYCTTTTINGQTGWRLPTSGELSGFAATATSAGWGGGVWSSTFHSAGFHYFVALVNGAAGPHGDTNSIAYTCVR